MQSGGVAKNSSTITSLDSNDWVGYKGVNFGSTGATKFIASIGVDNAYAGRAIFITIDGPLGKGKFLGCVTKKRQKAPVPSGLILTHIVSSNPTSYHLLIEPGTTQARYHHPGILWRALSTPGLTTELVTSK